ncbi:MAG: hypothetical protein N0E48_04805 [Candidatus Thiodiazotropha endolucinida]|nr:hypothetical protein [Candidatus Thiodiazotropha taylori]MCW4342668.1 hypothetical protein [Candidatus Thiodiazotropha endolucinida]
MKSVAFLLLTLLFLGSAAAANRNNPLPRDNMYVICSENDYECSRLKFMKDDLQTELGRLSGAGANSFLWGDDVKKVGMYYHFKDKGKSELVDSFDFELGNFGYCMVGIHINSTDLTTVEFSGVLCPTETERSGMRKVGGTP